MKVKLQARGFCEAVRYSDAQYEDDRRLCSTDTEPSLKLELTKILIRFIQLQSFYEKFR